MSSDKPDAVRIIGTSVRGPGHVEDDIPNQDSWAKEVLSDNSLIIAVGDGVGSADSSEIGSEIATNEVCRVLEQFLDSTESFDKSVTQEAFQDAFEQAKTAVREKAEDIEKPPSELQTTLLAVVVTPSGTAGAAVGDGGIVCQQGSSYELLVEREMAMVDLAASHITYPLVDDEWPSYRYGFTKSCDGVVIFSDGVEEFVWDDLESVRPEFFDGVFEITNKIKHPESASQKLEELLESEKFKKLSDDKTVAVADVPPNFGLEGLKTGSGDKVSLEESINQDENSHTYRLDSSPSDAAKIYEISDSEQILSRDKTQEMIENPPKIQNELYNPPSFAWPIDTLEHSASGAVVGYRMNLPQFEELEDILEFSMKYTVPESNTSNGLFETLLMQIGLQDEEDSNDDRYDIALSLAEGVNALHQNGYAIGDFHHSGIFVHNNRVIFTDCADYYIEKASESFNNGVFSTRYMPPTDKMESIESIRHGDRFALSVHIFQLLMKGYHPFDAAGEAAAEGDFGEKIVENPFPYRSSNTDYLSPRKEAPPFSELPPDLQDLFELCFIEGKQIPEVRPTAQEWVKALDTNYSTTGS